jgi:hypothetical protein
MMMSTPVSQISFDRLSSLPQLLFVFAADIIAMAGLLVAAGQLNREMVLACRQ